MKKKFELKNLTAIIGKYSYVLVTAIIVAFYAYVVMAAGRHFNWGHISTILSSQNTCIIGTMALGMALVIITRGIDLSLGANLVLTSAVCIMVHNITDSIPLMIIAAIASGALTGLLNGVLVGYVKMPPFVATLGTQLIFRSVMLFFSRKIDPAITCSSSAQYMLNNESKNYDFLKMTLGNGKINIGSIDIPIITLIFLLVVVIMVILSSKTKLGKKIYAVGSNEKSAKLAGINVELTLTLVYVITGMLVGVSGFLQACKVGTVTPASSGVSYDMYAVIAVVLGGVSMAGGKGDLLGVCFGALSYTAVSMIIISIPGLTVDIQNAFQGLVLITVIFIQLVEPMIKEKIRQIKKKKEAAE